MFHQGPHIENSLACINLQRVGKIPINSIQGLVRGRRRYLREHSDADDTWIISRLPAGTVAVTREVNLNVSCISRGALYNPPSYQDRVADIRDSRCRRWIHSIT